MDAEEINCKFPRFVKNYVHIFRGGDSYEEAGRNLEFAVITAAKGAVAPVDRINYVYSYADGRFEAHTYYLPRKFESSFNEVEKRRLQGVLSKVLFVDSKIERLEILTKKAIDTGLYCISAAKTADETSESVALDLPEVLVLRHDMPEKNGLEILSLIRQNGINVNVVVYGNSNRDVAKIYFSKRNVFYYVYDLSTTIDSNGVMRAIERTLNGEKGKNFEEFYR